MPQQNWSKNITFRSARVHEPESVDELRSIVAAATRLRVVGAGHSFNDIADTGGELVTLARLNRVVSIDEAARTVTVEGGIRYFELAEALHARGWALENLASLPHFTVAGACATGTHGSGDTNGGLATSIRGLDLVTATGDVVHLGRDDDDLAAIAVGLGAFGVIVGITLAIEPTYQVAQELHLDLPQAVGIAHLDEIMASAYSVSYFTTWLSDQIEAVWRKHRLDGDGRLPQTPPQYFGARRSLQNQDPRGELGCVEYTEQLLVPGPWHRRLSHRKPEFPSLDGDELQTEYFVPRRFGADALRAIAGLRDEMASAMRMGEIRTVAADNLWLSPFDEDSLSLHFSWTTDVAEAMAVLPHIEAALDPFDARPHWGKLYAYPADVVRSKYARFADFVTLADRYDPDKKFRNTHLRTLLG